MSTRLSYHPHPAAALNQSQFKYPEEDNYSPPPYYSESQHHGHLVQEQKHLQPPPYSSRNNSLPIVKESPLEESHPGYSTPGSRRPLPREDEEVFFLDYPSYYHGQEGETFMGTGSSIMAETKLENTSRSSMGVGVKHKIKSSFDKLKPSAWGSSDKLDLSLSRKFRKSANKPNPRRYSDSIAPTSIDVPNCVLTKRPGSSSSYNEVLIRKINITDSPAMPPDKPKKKNGNFVKNYFTGGKESIIDKFKVKKDNIKNIESKNTPMTSQGAYLNMVFNESNISYLESIECNGTSFRTPSHRNHYVDSPHQNTDLRGDRNYATINDGNIPLNYQSFHQSCNRNEIISSEAMKPKGTWNLLKSSSQQPTPPRPPKPSGHSNSFVVNAPNSQCRHPPKITPVSGKLLTNMNMKGSSIVRPTAFKPEIKPTYSTGSEHSWMDDDHRRFNETSYARQCEVGSYHLSSNIDSDRNSTSSIPIKDDCSASEGYESARVSSSTLPEQHSNEASPTGHNIKSFNDDVIEQEVERKVYYTGGEVEQLTQSFDKNITKSYEVPEDRGRQESQDVEQIKKELTCQMKSQAQSALKMQNDLQSRCQLLLEEKKRLQNMNMELEEQISNVLSDTSSVMHESSTTASILEEKLEDLKWDLQQKCGEISLLKGQIRESKGEMDRRNSELANQRLLNRELRSEVDQKSTLITQLEEKLLIRDERLTELSERLQSRENKIAELESYDRSVCNVSPSSYDSNIVSSTSDVSHRDQNQNSIVTEEQKLITSHLRLQAEVESMRRKIEATERGKTELQEKFNAEKQKWTEEKNKVLRYQQKLQAGYVGMKSRSEALEEKVRLMMQELDSLQKDNNSSPDNDLRYPTEI